MKTTMKIAVVMVVVGAMASLASAEVLVTMNKAAVTGPGGEDVYDFILTFGPADGEFSNARLVVEMDAATIQDPTPMATTGGAEPVPMDTWVNTVYGYHYASMVTSVIYNVYRPLPPDFEGPPVALLDWSFYDNSAGDNSSYSPAHIARVLVDADATGVATMLMFTTESGGIPTEFNFVIPEPATMALLGIGGIGVLLRRKRR